jgi:PD-(D/E)XK endonuclease
MIELTPSQKGAVAEAAIATMAMRLALLVLRPLCDGGRYDLAIDIGERLLRVQCKWASLRGSVLTAHCTTCRHTPSGYRRTTYRAGEVDAIGIYSPHTDGCYLVPIEEVEGRSVISLRLHPTKNNQADGVRWARDYDLNVSLQQNWGVRTAST